MVAQQQGPLFTHDEYEEFEERAGERHEYHNGYVFAMSGGTLNHSQISGNVYALVRAVVRGGHCKAFTEAMRVRATAGDDVYPDVSVTCDPRDLADMRRRVIAYPMLVIEVLSPSTVLYDQHGKFDLYRQIPALQELVLIESTGVRRVEVRRKDGAGLWVSTVYGGADDVRLDSLDCTLPMAAIYEDSDL
jgi:Uma2 family endonuclease